VNPKRVQAQLIRSVDAKLVRAKVQTHAITDAISVWGATGGNVAAHCELREGRLGFRLIVDDFIQPPQTEDWGILVGECVHNLRSALDNLAFALARLQCDPPPRPGRISFPIFTDKSKFEKDGRSALTQMPAAAASLIERLQPFNRDGSLAMGTPESDALVMLQWLNNADKHRIPSVVLVGQVDATHEASVEFYTEEDATASGPPDITAWNGPLQPGVVLIDSRTKNPVAKVKGQFKVRATVAIETNLGHSPLIVAVQSMGFYTGLVVDQFRSLFAE
jgi:hypothetical protein